MKAVIMAGGLRYPHPAPNRQHAQTDDTPFNRPIMLHIVELLKKHEITDLVMLLYHQPSISRIFSATAPISASR